MTKMIKSAILIILTLFISGCSYNFLYCDNLPSVDKVEKIFEENKDTIERLEKMSPTGSIWFEVNKWDCQGKGFITISYGSENQRKEIESILGDTFFGVPYKMYNV